MTKKPNRVGWGRMCRSVDMNCNGNCVNYVYDAACPTHGAKAMKEVLHDKTGEIREGDVSGTRSHATDISTEQRSDP